MKVTAAVSEQHGGPFVLRELDLGEPRAHEVRVRMVAAGICHSDIGARQQARFEMPHVFGHEGAGVVEEVGEGVTRVSVGDSVVLGVTTCGSCESCMRGRTYRCANSSRLNAGGGRLDGSTSLSWQGTPVHSHFFGQSSFATHAVVSERSITRLDENVNLRLAPAFACATSTGAGTVMFGMRPEVGDSIAIFGTGAVGMAAVMAARVAGCGMIIAVDRDKARLELALKMGATHILESTGQDLGLAIRELAPLGIDFTVETTAVPQVVQGAIASLRRGGVHAQLGVPHDPSTTLPLNLTQLALQGIAVQGFPSGTAVPNIIVPRLLELHRQGRFPVHQLVNYYPFAEIETAIGDLAASKIVKAVLLFD